MSKSKLNSRALNNNYNKCIIMHVKSKTEGKHSTSLSSVDVVKGD
jgi:hypothetical protein